MAGNGEKLRRLARDAGYYPAVDAPAFSTSDRVFADTLDLGLSAAAGEIYYTLDGSDPRASGGEVAPAAQRTLGRSR